MCEDTCCLWLYLLKNVGGNITVVAGEISWMKFEGLISYGHRWLKCQEKNYQQQRHNLGGALIIQSPTSFFWTVYKVYWKNKN